MTQPAQDAVADAQGPAGHRFERALPVQGDVVQIDATFTPGSADQFGLSVFGKGDSKTLIGYDTESNRLYVDRRNSGNVDFHPAFASIEDAPVALRNGKLELRSSSTGPRSRSSPRTVAPRSPTRSSRSTGPPTWGCSPRGGTARLKSLKVTPLWRILDDTPPDRDLRRRGPGTAAGGGHSGPDPGLGQRRRVRTGQDVGVGGRRHRIAGSEVGEPDRRRSLRPHHDDRLPVHRGGRAPRPRSPSSQARISRPPPAPPSPSRCRSR